MQKTVCHISYNHDAFDDRIYWKELLTLKEAGYNVVHLCVGDEEKDFISGEGVRIIQVARKKSAINIWVNRLLYLFNINRTTIDDVMEKAAAIKADLYHYHDFQLNGLVKKIKDLPQRPKVIYDVHEAFPLLISDGAPNALKKPLKYMIQQWELYCTRKCDAVIAAVEFIKQAFEGKIENQKLEVIHNYSFFEKEKPDNKIKEYDLISAGQISRTRGLSEMIEAIVLLKKKYSNLKFLIIGNIEDENYKHELITLIDKLQLKENVILHPPVPFSEIKSFYKRSKVGLCLLYNKLLFKIALPIKMFEYMAFGLPVIVNNNGLSAEITSNLQSGLVVDGLIPETLMKALDTLLSDEKLYTSLSNNAINGVKEFSWESEKVKLVRLYSSVLNS